MKVMKQVYVALLLLTFTTMEKIYSSTAVAAPLGHTNIQTSYLQSVAAQVSTNATPSLPSDSTQVDAVIQPLAQDVSFENIVSLKAGERYHFSYKAPVVNGHKTYILVNPDHLKIMSFVQQVAGQDDNQGVTILEAQNLSQSVNTPIVMVTYHPDLTNDPIVQLLGWVTITK